VQRRMMGSSTGGTEELDDGRPTGGTEGHERRMLSIRSCAPVGVWRWRQGACEPWESEGISLLGLGLGLLGLMT
jgi:hypothetical protein